LDGADHDETMMAMTKKGVAKRKYAMIAMLM
jgi:hypothetical protein